MMAVSYSVNRTVCFGYKLISPSLVLYSWKNALLASFQIQSCRANTFVVLLLCCAFETFYKDCHTPYNPSMRKVLLPPFLREEIKGQRGKQNHIAVQWPGNFY